MEEEIKKLEEKIVSLEEENSDLRVKIKDMSNAFDEIIYTAKQQK